MERSNDSVPVRPETLSLASTVLIAVSTVGLATTPLFWDSAINNLRLERGRIDAKQRWTQLNLDEARAAFAQAREVRHQLDIIDHLEDQPSQRTLDDMMETLKTAATAAVDAAGTSGAYTVTEVVSHHEELEHFAIYEQFDELYRASISAAREKSSEAVNRVDQLDLKLEQRQLSRSYWLFTFIGLLSLALGIDVWARRLAREDE